MALTPSEYEQSGDISATGTSFLDKTSPSNCFEVPSNGYLLLSLDMGTGTGTVRTRTQLALLRVKQTSDYQAFSFYVTKGVNVYLDNASAFSAANFYPIM